MKALWIESGELSLVDVPPPVPAEGELLLDVELAGICGTDLELTAGYAGFAGIPGHEFCARVAPGQGEWSGKRVAVDINVSCGGCDYCRRGLAKHCAGRTVLGIRQHGGAFAEQVTAPAANCLPLPEDIAAKYAVLVEPLAAALEILESTAIEPDDRVLIVGAGRLALLIAQVIRTRTANLDVIVRREERLAAFAPLGVNCIPEPGPSYDVVVEVSGQPGGFDTALAAVRPRGTIVLKSTYADSLDIDASRLVVDEIRLIGSRCGPMKKAIDWIVREQVALDHLLMKRYPLQDYAQAFSNARDPGVYKVLFDPRA